MRLIAASTSTLYGGGYLEYLKPELSSLFENVSSLLFIPYARPGGLSHDGYTDIVRLAFEPLEIEVRGIHEFSQAKEAVEKADGLFVGGGNTFVLLDQLYREKLLDPIKNAVLSGTPYLGTSAGSNITGPNVMTTNDMPIVHPPGLGALGLLPFNINPHYLDPDPKSKHQGETRETRIKEFHTYNTQTVIGLREGSWIEARDESMRLQGPLTARIFKQGLQPFELESGTDLRELTGQQ